jgi:predicted ABC-type ATPase
MDYAKPTLLVISGPNGAGKSTHIQTMLPADFQGIVSFDRDNTRVSFENILTEQGLAQVEVLTKARELMEERLLSEMKKAILAKEHFVLETPLSHPDYWKYIDLFENAGYQVQLNCLCLNNSLECIGRVRLRVIQGGHYVDPKTIKGVYQMNLKHIDLYKSTFKVLELYDGTTLPMLLARFENNQVTFAIKQALDKNWIR